MIALSIKAYLITGIGVLFGLVVLVSKISTFFVIQMFSKVIREFGYLARSLAHIIAIVPVNVESMACHLVACKSQRYHHNGHRASGGTT